MRETVFRCGGELKVHSTIAQRSDIEIEEIIRKDILWKILELHLKVCAFSPAKDVVQAKKVKEAKANKKVLGKK